MVSHLKKLAKWVSPFYLTNRCEVDNHDRNQVALINCDRIDLQGVSPSPRQPKNIAFLFTVVFSISCISSSLIYAKWQMQIEQIPDVQSEDCSILCCALNEPYKFTCDRLSNFFLFMLDSSTPASLNSTTDLTHPGRNIVIFVADGLRPSSVTPTDAPTLSGIRQNGVNFSNSHSLFPTFTTPNASAIATGHYLGDTGDFSNTIYAGYPVPTSNSSPTPFIENDPILGDIDEHFGGNFLSEDTLLAYARSQGYNTAAVGKLGPTLIQDVTQGNPGADGKVPVPQTIIIDDSTGRAGGIPLSADLTQRLVNAGVGATTPDRTNGVAATDRLSNGNSGNNTTPGTQAANVVQQQFFTNAVTQAILPKFAQAGNPFAMVYWSRDPDGTQHNQGDSLDSLTPGINGATSKAAVKNADNNLAALIQSLKDQGLYDNTDIFITADHGFSTISKQLTDTQGGKVNAYAASQTYPGVNPGYLPVGFVAIDLAHELGLPLYDADTKSTDGKSYAAVDPTQGQRPRNGDGLIGGSGVIPPVDSAPDSKVIVAANGGSDLIYVPDKDPATVKRIVAFLSQQDYTSGVFVDDAIGNIPGALPLSSINLKGSTSLPNPTIVVNFKTFATDSSNPAGSEVEIADTGLQQGQGMHGSFGRGDTFNNMAAIGPDFKAGFNDVAPVSNADVATTLASILGFNIPSNGTLQGRVISEALVGNPDSVKFTTNTVRSDAASNGQRTYLNYQQVGDTKYFDAAGFPDRTVGLNTQPIAELVGRTVLPAATFAPGATSGQFLALNNDGTISKVNANGEAVPFVAPNGQPVQGFSAVLPGPKAGTYLVMVDNGYGSKANSPDSLLRFYAVEPDFQTGKIYPVDLQTGARLSSFTDKSLFQLNDKNGKLKGFQTIVADLTNYPNSDLVQAGGIPVDPAIKSGRLLTGADFDLESFRRVADGSYWFGEEFGPFLLHVGADGTLLEAPIPTPNPLSGTQPFVQSADNPAFANLSEADKVKSANLPRSKGFEGTALSLDGTKLYTLLEGPLVGDPKQDRLLISEFDLKSEKYTGKTFSYKLDAPFPSRAIGDMTAINSHEFLVIERDNGQGDASNPAFPSPAQSKKIYKIDLNKVDANGFVKKELVADLLDLADPKDIGGSATQNGIFTFPFTTIEDVLPLDKQTLLVINDNNYPFSIGRTPGQADNNEFIKIHLNTPLDLPTGFLEGVAAGEATSTSAVLWTRTENSVTQQGIAAHLSAEVSTDPQFKSNVIAFAGDTDPNRDYTVKLDATGLESGTQYYYRFKTSDGDLSAVGTFKTAPAADQKVGVRFGFSGDTDGQWRPYGSLQDLSSQNLDYFIFLGDTIYETKTDRSPAAADPFTDTAQALADYQRKYRENLQPVNVGGFPGSQTLYQSQGNYILLDNHELGNKQFINGGAPTGTPAGKGVDATDPQFDANQTGSYIHNTSGYQALMQAFDNYQPIRETTIAAPNDPRSDGTQKLYYAQQWGANSVFINVDDRSYRDIRLKTAAGADDTGSRADNPDRTMLGKTQLDWLKQTLLDAQAKGTPWKIISLSSPIDETDSDGGKSWAGGYRVERNELLKFIADHHIDNVVFLSTDDHQNRVNEVTYLADPTDPTSRTRVSNVFTIVAGPIGAGGPDVITDHSISNLQSLTNTVVAAEQKKGLDVLGLDPSNSRVHDVYREGDPNADANRSPFDFYSPDTFNNMTLEISKDGKTLTVNNYGINSYAPNTFPEPSSSNPVRRVLGFSIDAV